MLIAALAGALAGFVHVLSGPDHLAAIAPLASNQRRSPWAAGALWGLGHSSGVLVVGLLALWLRGWLPIEAVSSWSERAVGVVLIGIGLWGLHRALRRHVHSHPHAHGPLHHDHAHLHAAPRRRPTPTIASRGTRTPTPRSSSACCTASPAARTCSASCRRWRFPAVIASVGYLGGYGAGTVAGMTPLRHRHRLAVERAHASPASAPPAGSSPPAPPSPSSSAPPGSSPDRVPAKNRQPPVVGFRCGPLGDCHRRSAPRVDWVARRSSADRYQSTDFCGPSDTS